MSRYGEGDFAIYKTYYDSPREDCNAYYDDCFCFKTKEQAIAEFYRWRKLYSDEPIGLSTNFDIPLAVRMRHDDISFDAYTLGGKFLKHFYSLRDAVAFRDQENTLALRLATSAGIPPELRARMNKDFRCKIYMV